MSYFELPSRFLLFICKFKQINYLGVGVGDNSFFLLSCTRIFVVSV